MSEVNQQFEDDNKHGSGGSRGSIDELARIDASTENGIWPMIPADIKEEFGLDLLPSMTGIFGNTESTSGSQALQLQFLNGTPTSVSTGMNIKGEDHKPFVVALVDGFSGQIVSTGDGAATEVEIVVLEGDCNDDEAKNWNSDDFNNKIVSEWNGKKILQGNTFLNLKEGIGSIDKISFTHNSTWKGLRKCRLGARCRNAVFATSVKEAKTESFVIRDKRTLLYGKHQTPSLSDQVWRLENISRGGPRHDRLSDANIKTVMDFCTLLAISPKRLKDILGVGPKIWKVITNHALMCKDDKGLYLYHYPRDGQKSNGVVFNISGQLVGLIAESQFVPSNKLPNDKKAEAQELVVSSSEHWEEVVSFNDEASLINHLQSNTTLKSLLDVPNLAHARELVVSSPAPEEVVSFDDEASIINHLQSGTTLNSLLDGLNLVIPQTIDTHDHTSLTCPRVITPIFTFECTNNENNWGYDNVGVTGQSQSPKRSAPEHAMSNSQKKPRDDHPRMSPSMPSVGTSRMTNMIFTGTLNQYQELNNLEHSDLLTPAVTEDDDYLQYFDFQGYDILKAAPAQRWKMVWRVVGWISIFSKVRKRQMTFCKDDMIRA